MEFEEEIFGTNVEATATVNGLLLRNIVTTYTDQVLIGAYNFSKSVSIKGKLQSTGTLNEIDLNDWYENGLKKHSNLQQTVDGQLTMYGDLRFDENVEGTGRINGLQLSSAVEELEKKKTAKYIIEKDVMVHIHKIVDKETKHTYICKLQNDYTKACKDVNHILRESEKQIHTFKYFELLQTTEFVLPIKNVHHFEVENRSLYIVCTYVLKVTVLA